MIRLHTALPSIPYFMACIVVGCVVKLPITSGEGLPTSELLQFIFVRKSVKTGTKVMPYGINI